MTKFRIFIAVGLFWPIAMAQAGGVTLKDVRSHVQSELTEMMNGNVINLIELSLADGYPSDIDIAKSFKIISVERIKPLQQDRFEHFAVSVDYEVVEHIEQAPGHFERKAERAKVNRVYNVRYDPEKNRIFMAAYPDQTPVFLPGKEKHFLQQQQAQ